MKQRAASVWIAIASIAVTGLVHATQASDSFHDARYKGWLFVANAVGGLVSAVAIYLGIDWGKWLGLLVAGGALIGYIASRTIGLPGLPAEPDAWFEPAGVVAVLAEVVFLAAFVAMQRRSTNA